MLLLHASYLQEEIFQTMREKLASDERLFLVGGAVRDLLLEKKPEDLDFLIIGDAKKLSRKMADVLGGAVYQLDDEHAAMRVLSSCKTFKGRIDISELREESVEEDLRNRDFTINAMAIEITNASSFRIMDPCVGQDDLKKGIIRACEDDSVASDPIRILRGIRLALSFGFTIDERTKEQIQQPMLLTLVSAERMRDELVKIFEPALAAEGFRKLREFDLLPVLFPFLTSEKYLETKAYCKHLSNVIDTLSGTETVSAGRLSALKTAFLPHQSDLKAYLDKDIVDGRKRAVMLFFAVLCWLSLEGRGDNFAGKNAKGLINQFSECYALSNQEKLFIWRIIKHKNRLQELFHSGFYLDGKSIYRFFRDTGESGAGLCLCFLADELRRVSRDFDSDIWTRAVLVCQQLIHHYFSHRSSVVEPPVLITGDDLISFFSLTPGPLFATLLETVREEQAAGNVRNKEEALSLVNELLQARKRGG